MTRILFVCTGNTCRSPMAEHLARQKFLELGMEIQTKSAGLLAEQGGANPNAIAALETYGLDLSRHKATQLTKELLLWADRIYTMTEQQAQLLRGIAPNKEIRPISPDGIPDPYGGSRALYKICAEKIKAAIDAAAEEWTL